MNDSMTPQERYWLAAVARREVFRDATDSHWRWVDSDMRPLRIDEINVLRSLMRAGLIALGDGVYDRYYDVTDKALQA